MKDKCTPKYFLGIDTEASNKGKKHEKTDIHTIQVCSSRGEHTGKVFWSPQEFKEWYHHDIKPRPKVFFAFTLPFEYGTLAAWELLKIKDEHGRPPWQSWAENPINLFYITVDKTRIPVFDIRILFHQLRYGNHYLTTLKKLGDYLSDYYHEDIHKLEAPIEGFGERASSMMRNGEIQRFMKYGIRDAYICAKAAEWVHDNIINKWLGGKINIEKLYSWGTVAKYYFDLPEINEVNWYRKELNVCFPNLWHKRIFRQTYAGRSEAFCTGNVGQVFYNDVGSLYPTAIIKTQCMKIKNVTECAEYKKEVLLGKAHWTRFYEATGVPYGWIFGDFKIVDDLWALPLRVGENNWYVKGTFRNALYHILDLQAANADILDIKRVIVPIFDEAWSRYMRRFENLAKIKLLNEYKSQMEKYCIKMTTNSTSGILGHSHPHFGATTNIPAYNTLLAQSHLFMSQLFHMHHSQEHPIIYTDTDSFFWDKPVGSQERDKIIQDCEPYPGLPFQVLDTVPLAVGVRGVSRPEGTAIFRGKMYYQSESSQAFSGWKPFPRFFGEIVRSKATEHIIARQVHRKWKTRDKRATRLKVGRWTIIQENWDLKKIKKIFRADTKRQRPTYDSYQLFLDDKMASSRAPTIEEVINEWSRRQWVVRKKR